MNFNDFFGTLSRKHRRPMEIAYAVALAGAGAGGNGGDSYRHGSVLMDHNRIICAKFNSLKTHPLALKFSKYPFLHAEQNCIFSAGLDQCQGTTLYVLRVLRDGSLAESKPCAFCQEWIKLAQIRNTYYSTAEDGMQKLM